jgi:hypothetical protein
MKSTRSLTLVDMHTLLSCIDEAKFNLAEKMREADMQETIHILCRLGLLSEPNRFEIFADFTSSPVYSFIREQLRLTHLVMDRPVRRLIFFNGPFLHFTFYNES